MMVFAKLKGSVVMADIKVLSFRRYSVATDGYEYSRSMATRERIAKVFCEPVEGTERVIDSSRLDHLELFKPEAPQAHVDRYERSHRRAH